MSAKSLLLVLGCFGVWSCSARVPDEPESSVREPLSQDQCGVGLSLFFVNGHAEPLKHVSRAARYIQEIDLVESVDSATDRGIQPLVESAPTASLDWSGVEQVEELWVPSMDGTFRRERYFRNARWMTVPSTFTVLAVNDGGLPVAPPLAAHAGQDARALPGDDGFVRRFVARQSATGCPSVGNCTGAHFTSDVLIQLREALHPERDQRVFPETTSELRLTFSQLPERSYRVALSPAAAGAELGYGFNVALEPVTPPANGAYYVPGETLSLRMSFRDGAGNRLHPPGQLPSYADFLAGQSEGGLRYLDLQLPSRLYYALKHRESNLLVMLSGPVHALRTPRSVVDPAMYFAPQVPFATRAIDGFTAVGQTIPPAGIILGGFSDPSLWSLPVSDTLNLTIPADAEPGTYIAAVKARRDDGGEALNRGTTVELQVGQSERTEFTAKTTCNPCHSSERTRFANILHGVADRRACFGCHSSLAVELDNALDIRVHTIHTRSRRVDADVYVCTNCHLTAPDGPMRGAPN